MDTEIFIQVAYALGIGVLVGLERSLGGALRADRVRPSAGDGSAEPPPGATESPPAATAAAAAAAAATATATADAAEAPGDQGEFLGVRTFAVLSLVGYGAALAADRFPALAAVALGGVAVLVVAMYLRATGFGAGITTEAAAIGVCALGMLCRHEPRAASVIALLLTVLLASKRFTHETVRKMRRVELTDTLKFLVVILIGLPLLPDRALDSYGAFNPYKVGLLVVLISGIGFVGYFLTRILGAQKGLGLTGILGGLTSSTAVTAAMAAEARARPSLRAICAFSTLAANATMFGRVLVVVAVLDRELVLRLLWSVGGMAVVTAGAAVAMWFVASRSRSASGARTDEVPLKNPFSVGPALKFAAFFVAILFVVRLSKTWLGDTGLYAAAALSGLADVDAITLSITEQTQDGTLLREIGSIGITIAVVCNSAVKAGIAISSGGWAFGRPIAAGLGLATVVGLALAFVV